MSARYTPLSNPRSAPDAERELEDAFDLDDEENEDESNAHESTPLTRNTNSNSNAVVSSSPSHTRTESRSAATATPGAYDFERAYDFPPPGSPPPPSSRALPNDFGNSNGLLPTAPPAIPKPKRSLFQRTLGAILPTHYQPVPTQSSSRPTGGGTENDGVFANVTAKPTAPRVVQGEDGQNYIMPEDSQKESPPSYREAQADAVPPYWETTIHAPGAADGSGDLIIDDLPTGSFLIFCLNIFVSFFFQFIGFLLTYLLHTSHAAKFGSRAGLGLTLIQYGLYSRVTDDETGTGGTGSDVWGTVPQPVPTDVSGSTAQDDPNGGLYSDNSRDWLSFLFMTLGWFLLLSSIIGFWRVKRWESSVRAPASPQTALHSGIIDAQMRANIEQAFGIRFAAAQRNESSTPIIIHSEGPQSSTSTSAPTEREERLRNNLRAIGIL